MEAEILEKTTSITPLLDTISSPSDMGDFSLEELKQLAKELREDTIAIVSKTGGHLGAGLGVVELTVALHYVFNTPKDKLIWDVGHQAYPHKILTGRRDHMERLRQLGGPSGFTKRSESPYDAFGAGHSSTSISAGVGMMVARDLLEKDFEVIPIIGDGAISAGMAYEAMNNAGSLGKRIITILNDNEMSIAPSVGAMSKYLTRLISSKPYINLRQITKRMVKHFPHTFERVVKRAEQFAKAMANEAGAPDRSETNFFEELGFFYIGPVDGHNLDQLVPILENIRDNKAIQKPILLHVITEKGKGFEAQKGCEEKYHAISKVTYETIEPEKAPAPTKKTFTKVFSDTLVHAATKDPNIVAITAAMPSGTGLDAFEKSFPERFFDVGIAEQHAVTFAAGLAAEGIKPFVAIYSTFLQRAYDQIVHDVAVQKLPVRFAIDRAGLVGADGATHAGSFDITFLATLPHMVVMAPSDEAELARMVMTASEIDDTPCAFRYPRGSGMGVAIPDTLTALPIGKGRIIQEAKDKPASKTVAILSLGTRLHEALLAGSVLEKHGISVTIADARFAKPLDADLIETLARNHPLLITIEEGSSGGFGAHVLEHLAKKNLLQKTRVHPMTLPDIFLHHGTQDELYDLAGLRAQHIVDIALSC